AGRPGRRAAVGGGLGPAATHRPAGAGAHHGALGHGAPHRLRARSGRDAAPAGAGGQAAGAVRPGRDAPHRRRASAASAAPAFARRAPAAGHRRPAQLLETHLAGGAPGNEGALPEAPVAGGSLDRARDPPGQAARMNGAAPPRLPTRTLNAAPATLSRDPTPCRITP